MATKIVVPGIADWNLEESSINCHLCAGTVRPDSFSKVCDHMLDACKSANVPDSDYTMFLPIPIFKGTKLDRSVMLMGGAEKIFLPSLAVTVRVNTVNENGYRKVTIGPHFITFADSTDNIKSIRDALLEKARASAMMGQVSCHGQRHMYYAFDGGLGLGMHLAKENQTKSIEYAYDAVRLLAGIDCFICSKMPEGTKPGLLGYIGDNPA